MSRVLPRILLAGLIALLINGCAAIDAIQLMHGNTFASHRWLHDQTSTNLPFELLNEHTIIPVTVNGNDLRLVLDTGASATVLFETKNTQSLLSELSSKFTVGGIGNGDRTDAYFINDITLVLGEVIITGLTTVFIKADDNPMFASSEVTYIDGVIGYDLFSRFVTEINFNEQQVSLYESSLPERAGYQATSIRIEGNLPYADIGIHHGDDSAVIPAMIDTGGIGSLLVSTAPGIPLGDVLYRTTSSGLGGESEATANRLDKVTLGTYEMNNVIAGVPADSAASKTILGTGILNRFNLVVDYRTSQILLSPNQYFDKEDYANVFGAGLLPHTLGAFVNSINPDSRAARMGMMKADVITSVNGDEINRQNYDAHREQLTTLTAVSEICYLRNTVIHCRAVEL